MDAEEHKALIAEFVKIIEDDAAKGNLPEGAERLIAVGVKLLGELLIDIKRIASKS